MEVVYILQIHEIHFRLKCTSDVHRPGPVDCLVFPLFRVYSFVFFLGKLQINEYTPR